MALISFGVKLGPFRVTWTDSTERPAPTHDIPSYMLSPWYNPERHGVRSRTRNARIALVLGWLFALAMLGSFVTGAEGAALFALVAAVVFLTLALVLPKR